MAAAKKIDLSAFEQAQERLNDVRCVAMLMADEIEGWLTGCSHEKKVQIISLTSMLASSLDEAMDTMNDFQDRLSSYFSPTPEVNFRKAE